MSVVRYCSQWFRDEISRLYPALDSNPGRWQFLQYLLYAVHFDEEDDSLVISRDELSVWLGKEKAFGSGHDSVKRRADDFSEHVFTISLGGNVHKPSRGRFRSYTVKSPLPPELSSLWEFERRSRRVPRIQFVSGAKVHVSDELPTVESSCEASVEMAQYMNGLPTNRFATAVARHWDEANAVAAELGDVNTPVGKHCAATMTRLLTHPKPLYKTVSKSTRIYPAHGAMLPSLKRCVREVICQDWMKCDLRAAQYAINVAIWNLEEFGCKLTERPYDEIIEDLGLPRDARAQIKELVFCLFYGMANTGGGKVNLPKKAEAIRIGLWAELKKHRIFKPLLRGREEVKRLIRVEGYATDAWGRIIPLVPHSNGDNVKSIMAQVSQSYEQRIMHAAYRLAQHSSGKHGFTILVNTFDGLHLHPHDTADANSWRRRISDIVSVECKLLGVPTSLEWSQPLALSGRLVASH